MTRCLLRIYQYSWVGLPGLVTNCCMCMSKGRGILVQAFTSLKLFYYSAGAEATV